MLLQDGTYYTRSDAVLRVLAVCDGPAQLLSGFYFVPRFIRDSVYDLVGKTRYIVFGVNQECPRPAPGMRSRFIEVSLMLLSCFRFLSCDEFLSASFWFCLAIYSLGLSESRRCGWTRVKDSDCACIAACCSWLARESEFQILSCGRAARGCARDAIDWPGARHALIVLH